MKSVLSKLILVLTAVCASQILMGQSVFTENNLVFTIINGTSNVKVKKQQNADWNILNIPETVQINGTSYTVTEIEENGFYQVNNLQKVTIPNSVTTIGNSAFSNCSQLAEVNIITGDNSVTIGNNVFYQCHRLSKIIIPNSVTSIGQEAFAYCGALREVIIGDNVTTIGEAAFRGCHTLHSILLPPNLERVEDYLFQNCHNFNELIIPANVRYVGEKAFENGHDVNIIFMGCGDIVIHHNAFENCHNKDIEFLCLGGDININSEQGGGAINWGNGVTFHVPCGMKDYYAEHGLPSANISEENCVSVSRQTGMFCLPETWEGYESWELRDDYEAVGSTYEAKEAWLKNNNDDRGDDRYPNFMPRNPAHPFYIKSGDTVTLVHERHIYPFNSINEGVLRVEGNGQLIERDTLFFDAGYILNVSYEIIKDGEHTYITRNHHESQEITAWSNSEDGTTLGEYRKEGNCLRDLETHCLLSINNDGVQIIDYDYYTITGLDNNLTINYCGNYPDVVSCSINQLPQNAPNNNSNGFYKKNDNGTEYIMHEIGETIVTIDATGKVTLHGTDYSYGHVKMHENLGGEIEIVVPATQGRWNFVGAPFNGYDLWSVKIGPDGHDVTVSEFNYNNNDWSNAFATVDTEVKPGEGFLAWPFYDGGIVFSTKRDYGTTATTPQTKIMESDFALNNDDVIVEKTVGGSDQTGRWLALANPYPAKLCVNSLVDDNQGMIRGGGVYVLTEEVEGNKQKFAFKVRTDEADDKYDIGVGQGFFVNATNNSARITFKKNQLHAYDESSCSHETHNHEKLFTQRDFVRIVMTEGNNENEVLFAQNEVAEQGYDIFDANKMFAMDRVIEHYFVTDSIALVKEEVKTLPYYATMNVRSFRNREVSFRATNVPEGMLVSIIDGEEVISLNDSAVYTTSISSGENANRFKVLFGSSVGLEDVRETEFSFYPNPTKGEVAFNEMVDKVEVIDVAGRVVLAFNNVRKINIEDLVAGVYYLRLYSNESFETQKLIKE